MLRSGASWHDRDALLIVNGTLEAAEVTPPEGHGFDWLLTVDTAWPSLDEALPKGIKAAELSLDLKQVASGEAFELAPVSVRLLMSDVSYSPRR